MKSTGRKMATMAAVVAAASKVISRAPTRRLTLPSLARGAGRCVSKTMMRRHHDATTRVRPSTVKVFRVKPRKYITMNVPRIEVGMASST